MERRISEKNKKVEPVVCFILIIGAILGFIVGWTNRVETANVFINILFCSVTAGFGSIMALFFAYYATSAVVEIQDAITKIKK